MVTVEYKLCQHTIFGIKQVRNILLQNVIIVTLKGVAILCVMLNTVSMYIQLPLDHEHDVSGREGVTNIK